MYQFDGDSTVPSHSPNFLVIGYVNDCSLPSGPPPEGFETFLARNNSVTDHKCARHCNTLYGSAPGPHNKQLLCFAVPFVLGVVAPLVAALILPWLS